jgi:hypothetical protein
MQILPLRRLIKRLEKKRNKIYLFSNKRDIKIIDNTKKLSQKEIDSVYRKEK